MSGFLSLCLLFILPTEPTVQPFEDLRLVEERVNVTTQGRQVSLTIDGNDDRVVAVWTSQRQEAGSSGIYGRVLDAQLRPLGPERHLNSQIVGTQKRPAVAMASDGAPWIVWQTQGPGGWGIVLRQFDTDLRPMGPEIPVDTASDAAALRPTVALAPTGEILVSWQAFDTATSSGTGIRARLFSADGQPLGGEIQITDRASAQMPGTLLLDDARFVVLWAEKDGPSSRLAAATLSTAEGRLMQRRVLDTPSGRPAIEPSMSRVDRGTEPSQLAIGWMQQDDDGYSVWARRFDVDLTPAAAAFEVATSADGWQSGATIHNLGSGRLAVLHNHDAAPATPHPAVALGQDIWLHTFDAEDRRDALPRRFNRAIEGNQRLATASAPRRAMSPGDGQLIVAWQGATPGDGHGVHLTALASNDDFPALESASRLHHTAAPAVPAVAPVPPIWRPNFRPSPRLEGLVGGADFGFEAIEETPWTPPDPEIAVSPDQLMFTSNGAITAFTKDGTMQWVDEIEGGTGFWGALGTGGLVFDPEVAWDPHAQRFVAMANEDTDGLPYFLLAVSRDNHPDDADDWHKYRFEVSAFTQGSNFIDSPNLALNRDYIFLTADFFGPDKYLLFVIDKSSVLEGGAATFAADLIVGTQSMGVPVVTETTTSTLYIVESTEFGTNDSVILHAVTDPFGSFNRETVTLPVDTYTFPIDPPQRDTTVRPELFEPRFWSVAQAGGSIWAVHHVDSSRVRVRWYEFALNGWPESPDMPTLVQSGEIDLGDGIHTFFPSLDADAQGNAAITFSRSATDEYISIWRAVRTASMPAGTFGPAVMVQESANAETSGRWGDYSGTQADPGEPGVFWGIHQFTNGTTDSWRTWAARYDAAASLFIDGFESGDTSSWSATNP